MNSARPECSLRRLEAWRRKEGKGEVLALGVLAVEEDERDGGKGKGERERWVIWGFETIKK